MKNPTKELRIYKMMLILKNAITRICEIKSKNKDIKLPIKDNLNERNSKNITPKKLTPSKNKIDRSNKSSKDKLISSKTLSQ